MRIYGRVIENNSFPTTPVEHQLKGSNYKCPSWTIPFALHHKIRDTKCTDKAVQAFIEVVKKMKMVNEASRPSASFCRQYRELQQQAESYVLSRGYDIVLCTCNEVSGFRLSKIGQISHCIIDECGMTSEPETMVPISHCKKVVLIGDHAQLQPVIKYEPASKNGLSRSLFERYAVDHGKKLMCTLKTQYRMVRKL